MADGAVRSEAASKFGEVDGPLALVYLDRIPSTERNMRPSFAGEMDEVMLLTGPAALAQVWPS